MLDAVARYRHDKEHVIAGSKWRVKRMLRKDPNRLWDHTSWKKRPMNPRCTPYGLIIKDIHDEMDKPNTIYFTTYFGVNIHEQLMNMELNRPISLYNCNIPSWCYAEDARKTFTRIKNSRNGGTFWDQYFRVSSKQPKGEPYFYKATKEFPENEARFKVQRKHKIDGELLPGSESTLLKSKDHGIGKREDRYKNRCPVCGGRKFDKFQTKTSGVDKWVMNIVGRGVQCISFTAMNVLG